MEIQSCFPVAPMISKYFLEYLRKYAGRFMPVLIDQLLVQNVMTHIISDSCSAAKSSGEAMTLVASLRGDIHSLTTTVNETKAGLGSSKAEVSDELKKKVAKLENKAPYCTYCKGNNHIERNCHAKAADLLKKAATVPVP